MLAAPGQTISAHIHALKPHGLIRSLLIATLCITALTPPVYADTQSVFLWNRNFDTAPVNEVLELAFEKTLDLYPAVNIVRTAAMEQDEAVAALRNASAGIDVLSTASSHRRDQQFLTISFPILKGLLGYRLCLIRKDEQSLFTDISTAYDFTRSKLRICQGEHWPDTDILQRNGFSVITSEHYLALFNLLKNKQCDCFLRGAQEIVPEFTAHNNELAIEENIVLRYPQPGFFYVNKNNIELATRIELGLLRALDDGSYQALFERLMGDKLQQLRITQRTVIPLNNPNMSVENRRIQSINSLWFSL